MIITFKLLYYPYIFQIISSLSKSFYISLNSYITKKYITYGIYSSERHSYSLTSKLKINTNFETEFNIFAHQTQTTESSHAKQERLFT